MINVIMLIAGLLVVGLVVALVEAAIEIWNILSDGKD